MSKPAKPANPAAAEATAPSATQAAPSADLPMPTRGGCYIRLPDGSLAPDPTTEQAPSAAQESAP